MEATIQPRVLFVYFTYTQQSLRVAETMAGTLRERGCDVTLARIELTDQRWADRFSRFPLRHAYLDILGMALPQARRATGEIRIPDEARRNDYDLVCIGSPTWWFLPSVPIRSFLESDEAGRLLDGTRFAIYVVCRRYWSINFKSVRRLATRRGGEFADGTHFTFEGGQVRSLMSLLSYFGKGENRERYLGVRIPPSLLKPDFADQARTFADGLADRLAATASRRSRPTATRA